MTHWLFLAASVAFAADRVSAPELIRMAESRAANFREALIAALGEAKIKDGSAFLGEGPNFIWAVEADPTPVRYVDKAEVGAMTRLAGKRWYRTGQLKTGTAHAFYYMINGQRFGGNFNVPALAEEAYEHTGVPRGKLSEKLVHTSKIYDGT